MQVTLLNYETQYWRKLTNAKQALAKIKATIGSEEILQTTINPSNEGTKCLLVHPKLKFS